MQAGSVSLGDLTATNALLHAHRPAFIESGRTITHGELERRTNRLARMLLSRGICKGDRIALLLNDGAAFIELMIAAGKIGAIATLLNWRLSPTELEWILANASPRALFRAERFASLVGGVTGIADIVVADDPASVARYEGWAEQGPDTALAANIDHTDPLFMMFTSGTTGRPKGCVHSHGGTIAQAFTFALRRGFQVEDRFIACNPLFHVAGLGHITAMLAVGGTSVFVPRDAEPIAPIEFAVEHRCTVTMLAQPMRRAWELADDALRGALAIRTVTTGAGIVDPHRVAFIQDEWGARISGGWGQTECWGFATMIDYPDMLAHPRSIGWAVPPLALAVLDPDGSPIDDPEAEGELGVRGPTVMLSYWDNPEASAAALGTGWLRTGDHVARDRLGLFTVKARIKELIKSGGENVYPTEVESVLQAISGVADCAVAGVRDPRWGEAVKAFVVLGPGASLPHETITQACRVQIAGYKRPRYLEFVEAIPRDFAGKIRRFELSARPVTPDQAIA